MKIELRCPDCRSGWLVDEERLSGKRAECPRCNVPLVGVERPGSTEPRADPPARRPTASSEPVFAIDSEETVVCPRCQLHFIPRPDRDRQGPEQTPTALIVEDMSYFRELARDALDGHFSMRFADNVGEALNIVRSERIAVILLDLTLGAGDDGRRLLQALQPKPCPILIYTAKDEEELYDGDWQDLRALGADGLVVKGFNVGEELLRKVADVTGVVVAEPST